MNQLNRYTALRRQAGFTLVELIIVVIILGILAAMSYSRFSSGITSQSTAAQYYTFASRSTDSWSQLVTSGRLSIDPTSSNPFFQGNNDLLDVLVAGEDMVAANYKTAYRRSGLTTIEDAVQVETYPSAGTPGSYTIGGANTQLSVSNLAGRDLQWTFTNVSPEIIEALLIEYEPSSTYNSSGDSSNRRIRYTAESGGLHTLNIVQRVR